MKRDVNSGLGEAVRLQVGCVLVDDAVFLEIGEIGHDVADAVAIGRCLGRLNDRPGTVRVLAQRCHLAGRRFDLDLVDLVRLVREDLLLGVLVRNRPL